MKFASMFIALTAATLTGCSGASGVTTGAVSGAGAPAAPVNDVTARAMQVGATSARAVKCGYNFDPIRLKSSFLAAEAKLNPADLGRAEQVFDIAHNGVVKAVATKSDYCSETKTAEIKEDLTRHLAGDFAPRPRKAELQAPGWFDSIGDGNGSDSGPGFGTGDWWDAQDEKRKG